MEQGAVGLPGGEGAGGRGVAVGPVGFVGQVDDHHVVRVAGDQGGPVVGVDDVVGRGGDVGDGERERS